MAQTFSPLTFLLTAVTLGASSAGVWYSIRLADRLGVIDVPNERSSHVVPTPRMGGVPMIAAAVLAMGCWVFWFAGEVFYTKGLMNTFLFAFGMSVLGFWDDLFRLSPLFRFLVQFSCSVFLLWTCSGLFSAWTPGGWTAPKWIWILAGAIWMVWMLNLYNFMDGIDGLAGGEAAVVSSFFFLVFAWHGESGWAMGNLFVAAAAMGFLVHNWPPARVFMGDAGSAFLGAFYGMQSVIAPLTTEVPVPVLLLPLANFILDTTVTLLRRVGRREKWYAAHRTHYYQRMTNIGMSHGNVSVLELLASSGFCGISALYLYAGPMGRVASIAVGLSALIGVGIWIGKKERLKGSMHGR